MILALGTVITAKDGRSVIRFKYPKCEGCNDNCARSKKNEIEYTQSLTVGTDVVLKVPTYGISLALFLTLGVPLIFLCLGYACTRSMVWACVSMGFSLLANIVIFRHSRLSDYLLRPAISRIT